MVYSGRVRNPMLNQRAFDVPGAHDPMTLNGVLGKSAFLIGLVLLSATALVTVTMESIQTGNTEVLTIAGLLTAGAMIVGFVCVIAAIFVRPEAMAGLSMVYAVAEGLFIGGLTMVFEFTYPGIAIQAMLATGGIFVGMLIVYRTGLIPVTENLRIAVMSGMIGVVLIYLLSLVFQLGFGLNVPFIHGSGPIGIGFSLFVIGLGALSLAWDFDFIEHGVEVGAPKQLEWRAAFGLLVTLVWIYIEVLRLIAKLRNN